MLGAIFVISGCSSYQIKPVFDPSRPPVDRLEPFATPDVPEGSAQGTEAVCFNRDELPAIMEAFETSRANERLVNSANRQIQLLADESYAWQLAGQAREDQLQMLINDRRGSVLTVWFYRFLAAGLTFGVIQ